ncbi:MAG: hypothetical protein WBN04_03380 [Paracoccaceae bacterium]
MAYALRARPVQGQPITLTGFDGVGVLIGFVAFVLAAAALGPVFGISLLIALLFHELGHVVGHQILGHRQTRFRLIPQLSDAPISDHPHQTEGQVLFVALMGPGFCLAPMVLAHLAAIALAPHNPEVAASFRAFAITCGTVNFISLLPFWPLDGGRCVRIAAASIWPAFAPAITVFMAAALAAAAWRTGLLALLVLAGIGVHSLLRGSRIERHPLHPDTGVVALAAYAFTLAAHFSGGWLLMSHYL